MFHRKITNTELEEYLREPIYKFGWDPQITPEELAQARAALEETLARARKMRPRTHHVFIGRHDWVLHDCDRNYLRQLLAVRRSLAKKQWNDACGELIDVLHFFRIEDGRVLNEIISLLEEFLQ